MLVSYEAAKTAPMCTERMLQVAALQELTYAESEEADEGDGVRT